MTIEFNYTHDDDAIAAAHRFNALADGTCDITTLTMDILAADGVNGNMPLDWDRLNIASDATFAHDIAGIRRHMDRVTGILGGCFVPRLTLNLPTMQDKIAAAIDAAHSAGMISERVHKEEMQSRLDALAQELMATRPDLAEMSLDEWLVEHMDSLSQSERADASAIIAAYFT